jgi:hypothetical protein
VHGCAKRTIGLEIVLNAPMELLGDDAQVETFQVWSKKIKGMTNARYVQPIIMQH